MNIYFLLFNLVIFLSLLLLSFAPRCRQNWKRNCTKRCKKNRTQNSQISGWPGHIAEALPTQPRLVQSLLIAYVQRLPWELESVTCHWILQPGSSILLWCCAACTSTPDFHYLQSQWYPLILMARNVKTEKTFCVLAMIKLMCGWLGECMWL